jgi:hypothetical protein
MQNKKTPVLLKLVPKDSPTAASEKPAAKVTFCKALDCTQKAQTKGLCRLHYIKSLAAAKLGQVGADKEEETIQKSKRWNRRKLSRATGFEANVEEEISQVVEDRINQLGSLDGELTSILGDEDLNPFKKTG